MKTADIPKIRCYYWERELLEQAAEATGMTLADFIRDAVKRRTEELGMKWEPPINTPKKRTK